MVSVDRLEVVPVCIPMEGGDHEAAIVIQHGDGLVGLGEAPVIPERGGSLAQLVSELRGERPARSAAARVALETARLDLLAQRQGRPLAALLGGVRRQELECSALVQATRPDLVARGVERSAGAGFRAFKLKAVAAGGMLDQERLGAARWAAGPGARLRLDFNGRLGDREAAVRLAGLAPFRLELAEQPLPADAPAAAWKLLQSGAGALLAADESLGSPRLARELAAAGIALALKLATVGGPLAAFQLAAGANGSVTVGSSFETSIGLAAALHLACALPREPLACGLATGRLLDDDLATGLSWRGPFLRLPEQPGLGVTVDPLALEIYRLDR
jgi:L-alanine-DL-glutamate epimerase-like enolase superfamily enzyme